MSEKNPFEWKEQDIQQFIIDGLEENIHLDYKGLDALAKTDSKKKEISKDVSAFANSDGGVIIYGVREHDDPDRRHLPERIESGYDPSDISKEWLEHVINSNIEPKVIGLLINPIKLSNDRYIYVVIVPKSLTAHQASDLRYYKRYNFESVAMKDHEIDDVRNRATKAVLHPKFYTRSLDPQGTEFELRIHLLNDGNTVAHHFMIEISLPKSIIQECRGHFATKEEIQIIQITGHVGNSATYIRLSYNKPATEIVIFPKQEYVLIPSAPQRFIQYRTSPEVSHEYMFGNLYWKLYADNTLPIEGEVRLNSIPRPPM